MSFVRALLFALIAAAVLAGAPSQAVAQGCGQANPNCIVPTAPPGTSNNQAASTAFVQTAIQTGIFDTPNTWTELQTYTRGIYGNNSPYNTSFPGNAPYYFTCGNAPSSPTAVYNCAQFSIGTPLTGSAQFGENTVTTQQALVGTADCPVGSTFTGGCIGVAGYARNNSTVTPVVGMFGAAMCAVQNCAEGDAFNGIITNGAVPQATVGFDAPLLIGNQINVQIAQKTGAVNPTVGLYAYYVVGGGNATNTTGTGFAVDQLSIQTGAKWSQSFYSLNGSSNVGFRLGTLSGTEGSPPATSGSQQLVFDGYASSVLSQAILNSDGFGNLISDPANGSGGGTFLTDGLGNNIFEAGVNGAFFNQLTTAGMLCNAVTTGLISSSVSGCDGLLLALNHGGTGASLAASNGGIVYSTASALAVLAGTATADKMLMSGASAAPLWSTSTWPTDVSAAGQMLNSSGAHAWAATATPTLGASGTLGSLTFGNATSGLLTVEPVTGALGTVTVSIPAATDTLVNLASAQTLTNKSISGSQINSGTVPAAQVGFVAWPAYTPTLSCQAGTLTTATAVGNALTIGKNTSFSVTITVTTAGTCQFLQFSLPNTTATGTVVAARNTVNGSFYQGYAASGGTTILLVTVANAGTVSNGDVYVISGEYENS